MALHKKTWQSIVLIRKTGFFVELLFGFQYPQAQGGDVIRAELDTKLGIDSL